MEAIHAWSSVKRLVQINFLCHEGFLWSVEKTEPLINIWHYSIQTPMATTQKNPGKPLWYECLHWEHHGKLVSHARLHGKKTQECLLSCRYYCTVTCQASKLHCSSALEYWFEKEKKPKKLQINNRWTLGLPFCKSACAEVTYWIVQLIYGLKKLAIMSPSHKWAQNQSWVWTQVFKPCLKTPLIHEWSLWSYRFIHTLYAAVGLSGQMIFGEYTLYDVFVIGY